MEGGQITESDIKKIINTIKNEINNLSSGADISKNEE